MTERGIASRTFVLPPALKRVGYRLTQGIRYLIPCRSRRVDNELAGLLSRDEFAAVARLPAPDRRHLLDVYHRLRRMGCADDDVLKAALLHDAGKVDGRMHVGLVHRTLAVLLRRWLPGLINRLARPHGHWLGHGLYLVAEHPRLGAELARRLGCNERVCWLIAHHHDASLRDDPGLRLLHLADEGD